MNSKISRRQMLALGATTIAGAGLLGKRAEAKTSDSAGPYRPLPYRNVQQTGRGYWQKSYSGGAIDVKSLAPVLPGTGYNPVVVPDGFTLPFKVIDGVKVFHLIAEE